MLAEEIKHIAVVGAGTMGQGIGQEFARAGYQVVLHRRSRKKLQLARQGIRRSLGEMVDWGLIGASEIEPTLRRIRTTTSLEETARNADLVVEAVFEDLDLKQRILRDLDGLCPPHTILASNTSSLMPGLLASVTKRPERVLVLHFCYPPHLLPLVEVVRAELTSDETVDVVCDIARAIGKCPVVLQKEAVGFIINRLQVALLREALFIVEQGIATAQDVDIAAKESFGRRLAVAGPIEMAEVMDDWKQTLQFTRYILPDLDTSTEPSSLMQEKVAQGELGAETGRGFYEWTPEHVQAWRNRLWSTLAGSLRSDQPQP